MTTKSHDEIGNRIDPFEVTCDVCGFTESLDRQNDKWSDSRELSKQGWLTIHIGMTPYEEHPINPYDELDLSGMNNMHLCHNCNDPEWVNGTKIHQVFVEALHNALFCDRCGSYLFHEEFKLCNTCMSEKGVTNHE